jgi:hypothetical protein
MTILAVILGLAIWTMWPALRAPESSMVCNWMHPDCISNHWLLVWVAERLGEGQSILHNDRYYWPVGDAPVLAGNGAEGVLYAPLHQLLGWPTGAVFYLTGILMLNGVGGWALGRALGAGRWAALLPAAAAIASPYLLGELGAGRFSQVSIGWMLLTLAAWLRLCEAPSRRRAILAGLLWAVTAFFYWFHAWFVAIALVLFLVCLRMTRQPLPWRSLMQAAATAAVLIAPWAWAFLGAWSDIPGTSESFPPAHAAQDSAWPSIPFLRTEDIAAMPALVWALGLLGALTAARSGDHRARWALVCWALFTLLAMGPFARWAPYTVLYDLGAPLRRFWWPLRHVALAGVLWAAMGAVWITGRRGGRYLAVGAALSAPLMLQLAGMPHQVQTTRLSLDDPGLLALRDLPQAVLLQLPIAPEASGTQLGLLFQMIHDKPTIGGHAQWVDRVRPKSWDERLASNSYLSQLAAIDRGEAGETMRFEPADLEALRQDGLRWLVLDRSTYPIPLQPAVKAHRAAANALFGRPVIHKRGLRVWDMAQWSGAGTAALPAVQWPDQLQPAGPEHPLSGMRPHPPLIQLRP